MKTVLRSFSFSLLLLALCPFPAFAGGLDVFDTGKIFPIDFLFEKEVPSLKNLDPAERDQVLQKFLDARDKVESPVQHKLLHLGISYIHLLQKNYLKAFETLNQEINGEFILEDFKIYFLTVALQALAEGKIQQDDLDQAIEYLKAAHSHQMTLFRDFPASPFYEDVPGILAQIEIQLGETYFKKENYPAAWSSYNKALGRQYPDCEGTHYKIYTALAQTYEAGKNLNEAADIHIFLLNQFPSRQTTIVATVFLNNNLKALEYINGNVQHRSAAPKVIK